MNYDTKFKDRNPQKTIIIIKNYFENNGYIIQEEEFTTEIDTFYTGIKLFFQNHLILFTLGKGTTLLYAKASGYGELYERYCNNFHIFSKNYFFNMKFIPEALKQRKYVFDKNEKIVTFEEQFSNIYFQNFKNAIEISENQLKTYLNFYCNNVFYGVPFKHAFFSDKETLYLDPRILYMLTTSTGMCAGNSFEEAFNQGLSELYEHHVIGTLFDVEFSEYYALNLDNLELPETLTHIIENIQINNDIYIIDCSYNYNLPVLLLISINKFTKSVNYNIGSHPNFYICLERVFTELYQGKFSYNQIKINGIMPSKNKPYDFYQTQSNSISDERLSIPEFIINNLKHNYLPNNKIFLFQDIDNIGILNYNKNLCKFLNIDIYYWNCSKTQDIYALKIFSSNLSGLDNFENFKKIPFFIKDYIFKSSFYKKNFIYNLFNNEQFKINIDDFNQIKLSMSLDSLEQQLLSKLDMNDNHYLFYSKFNLINYILNCKTLIDNENIYKKLNLNEQYLNLLNIENIKSLLIQHRYLLLNYSSIDINNIIKFLNINNDLKLININDFQIIILKLFFEPIYIFYSSLECQQYLKILLK